MIPTIHTSLPVEDFQRKRRANSDDIHLPTAAKRSYLDPSSLDTSIQHCMASLRRKLTIEDICDESMESHSNKRQKSTFDDPPDFLTDIEDNIEVPKAEDNLTNFGEIEEFPLSRKKKILVADILVDELIRKQRRRAQFTGVPLDFDSLIPNTIGPHPTTDHALSLTIPVPLIISARSFSDSEDELWDIDTDLVVRPPTPPTTSALQSKSDSTRSHADCFLDNEIESYENYADAGDEMNVENCSSPREGCFPIWNRDEPLESGSDSEDAEDVCTVY